MHANAHESRPTSVRKWEEEPHGFSDAMPILDQHAALDCRDLTRMPRRVRYLSRSLGFVFLAFLLGVAVMPWRQFLQGKGRVIAYNPLERAVTVEAPVPGRVVEAAILEGQSVKEGDLLFRILDNDPFLVDTLTAQRTLLEEQRLAAVGKRDRLSSRVTILEEAVPQALDIAQRKLDAAKATEQAALLQYNRIRDLFEDERGLVSQRDFELATRERDKAIADVLEAQSALLKTKLDLEASLESARASADSAEGDLRKVEKDLRDLEIKIRRQGRQDIYAPRDGVALRVTANEGQFLKSGAPLCVVTPDASEFVAEIWVDGVDMPLIQPRVVDDNGATIEPGSPVRLQFEGWPAVQFVGWPSVAVGTFGGEVIAMDPTDDGTGRFRILVAAVPDTLRKRNGEKQIIDWPQPPIMRQGIQAQGWVLLDQVPLWFEIWRQLNGFPPAISAAPTGMGKEDMK